MQTDVHRFSLKEPSDVSGLAEAIKSGVILADQIAAVIGKTHGNGLVNDYTRGYLSLSLSILIAEQTGERPEDVRARIPFIFSGGVEGVLSPHYTVFTVDPATATETEARGLAIGIAFTPELSPADVGRQPQIDLTATAVRAAMARAGIESAEDVHFVQIKGPAFSKSAIAQSDTSGVSIATADPGKLMAYGRAASALGVGVALGEISPEDANSTAVLNDFSLFSTIASVSAGVEVCCNEIVVIGIGRGWTGPLQIAHAPMKDALDLSGVQGMLDDLDFRFRSQLAPEDTARLRAAFVKCEASPDGMIRGHDHTMLNDGDMDQQRHIRGAVGALLAGMLGDTALFVSGGAEHQGPSGGGMVSVIVDCSEIVA